MWRAKPAAFRSSLLHQHTHDACFSVNTARQQSVNLQLLGTLFNVSQLLCCKTETINMTSAVHWTIYRLSISHMMVVYMLP